MSKRSKPKLIMSNFFVCLIAAASTQTSAAKNFEDQDNLFKIQGNQKQAPTLYDKSALLSADTSRINLNPKDYKTLYSRSLVQRDPRKAIEDLTSSLKYNRQQSDIQGRYTLKDDLTLRAWCFQNRAYWLCTQGKYKEAIDDLNHAIVIRPAYAANYQNRGAAFKAIGENKMAVEDFSTATRLRKANLPDQAKILHMQLGKRRKTN